MKLRRCCGVVVGVGDDFVTCTPEPPWMLYIQISCVPRPSGLRDTRTYSPSGVQAGEMKSPCLSLLSCLGSDPSAFAIHRLSAPSRSLVKGIILPSGENTGWLSNGRPLVIRLACPPFIGIGERSPTISKRMHLPPGEPARDSQFPSSS